MLEKMPETKLKYLKKLDELLPNLNRSFIFADETIYGDNY